MLDLIVSVPDHCLSFYFNFHPTCLSWQETNEMVLVVRKVQIKSVILRQNYSFKSKLIYIHPKYTHEPLHDKTNQKMAFAPSKDSNSSTQADDLRLR